MANARFTAWIVVVAACQLTAVHSGWAQEEQDPADNPIADAVVDKEWTLDASLYIWLAGLDGDVGLGPVTADVDVSFWDVLDEADSLFGWDGRIEAWHKNKFGICAEAVGMVVEIKNTTDTSPSISVDSDVELVFFDFELGYRLFDKPVGDGEARLTADALGGFRYTHFKNELDAAGTGKLGLSGTLGGSADWFEPIIGGRLNLRFNDKFSTMVRGNVGGFGTADADLSWRLTALFAYYFNPKFKMEAGYQVYGLDMENGGGGGRIAYDGIVHGPVIGATLSF